MITTTPVRRVAVLVALALTMTAAQVGLTRSDPAAQADTRPPEASIPATVSSDPLDTVQVDGVVWTQVTVGNTVYVGGNFATARPARSAPGVNTVTRANLLAFSLSTGQLVGSFAPTTNGQVRALAASPDGTRLYVGGQFTTVNGSTRNRVAAVSTATGALLPFNPNLNSSVYGMAATATTVYFGGPFSTVGGTARVGAAAVDATTGALRPAFDPTIAGGAVQEVVVSPDGAKVVLGGSFTSINGSDSPGYGLVMLNSANADRIIPFAVNSVVRNAGSSSAILSLSAAPDGFYGAGYVFNKSGGNLEGSFKADWNGNLVWLEDCHGDTYSVFPAAGAVYKASHAHYCGNVGSFGQNDPQPQWKYQRGLAFSTGAYKTISRDPYAYFNFEGNPHPRPLTWYPDINAGTFTGQNQGAWSVTGNNDYVVFGGEFTQVNGKAQQGLVRFARSGIAPDDDGPRLADAEFVTSIRSFAQGLRLSWPANHDRDNELLTYRLFKNGSLVFTTTARSTFWQRPQLSYLDKAVTPGTSYGYRLQVTDPLGNSRYGNTVNATAAGGSSLSAYNERVLADNPASYWRLNETSGTTVGDTAGSVNGTRHGSVALDAPGAVAGDPGSYRFSGAPGSHLTMGASVRGPMTFSVEAWFKTSSTRGGKIIGYGSAATGDSGNYDRHLYLGNSGRVYFGAYVRAVKTVNSAEGFNDGQWHHVVGTLSPDGMALYVEGQLVGSRADARGAALDPGYWRVGGDQLNGWPGRPTSNYLAGDLDEVAVYPVALSAAVVQGHHSLGNQ